VGALLTRPVLALGDRKKLIMVLYSLNAAALVAMFFTDPHSLGLLIALNIVANLIAGPTPAILWSMYADVADYSEWKFKRRSTGLIFSGSVFSQKIGLAIGSGGLAFLLGRYGFHPNQVQDVHSVLGIKLLFSILPAAFGFLGALAVLFYPISDTRMKVIEGELRARKSEAEAAVAVA
jgi:GPH family glycoside/pentoside/hexuronide:cation symporter